MTRKVRPTASVLEWRKKNPLRRWLNKPPKRGKLTELLAELGIERQTAYGWMYGTSVPNLRRFAQIKKLTGIDSTQWVAWLNQQPK